MPSDLVSVSGSFNETAALAYREQRASTTGRKRLAPFSIRLTETERARLTEEASGTALGAYIKAKALGGPLPRRRSSGQPIQDQAALAQVLALLGRSHLANNLNQLAKLANTGSLPLTPEIASELLAAIEDVRDMRRLLLSALGLKLDSAR